MIDKKLTEITSKLDFIFTLPELILEEEVKSHFSKYLCVLTSGYIEESLKIIIKEYAKKTASPNVLNFVNQRIKNITNLNSNKIENILAAFSKEWVEQFVHDITDEEKDALDSIVANKNNIAHGRNVGISFIRIKGWYQNVKGILVKIRKILNV